MGDNRLVFIPYEQFNCCKVLISRYCNEKVQSKVMDSAEKVGYNSISIEQGEYFSVIVAIEFNSNHELKEFRAKIQEWCIF